MSKESSSICLVLAVTSDTAFLELLDAPSLLHAYSALIEFFPTGPIHLLSTATQNGRAQSILGDRFERVDFIICETTRPQSVAAALRPILPNHQGVLVHDASRPFVDQTQFTKVLEAFDDDIDAVRPAMPFTETLKILTGDSVVEKTLDRSTVLRISTPEIIRVSAIDMSEPDNGWFLPLAKDARIVHVEGNPRGLRINSEDDARLMELQQD